MTSTVLRRPTLNAASPHPRLSALIERDMMGGHPDDPPRHHMTAAANPGTSRSLALALSAELLDDDNARTASPPRTTPKRPRTKPPEGRQHSAKPEPEPVPEAPMQRREDATVILLPPPDQMAPCPHLAEEAQAGTGVIEMAGPSQPSTALVTVAPPPGAPEPRGGRGDLLRHMRRTWMGSAFKSEPHCLLVATVRPAIGGTDTPEPRLNHPSMAAILNALGEVGAIFEVSAGTVGILLRAITLHQAVKIGEALAHAVDKRTAGGEGKPVLFSAGVAALYRDDDPVSVMLLAERCFAEALSRDASAVVGENNSDIRHMRLK